MIHVVFATVIVLGSVWVYQLLSYKGITRAENKQVKTNMPVDWADEFVDCQDLSQHNMLVHYPGANEDGDCVHCGLGQNVCMCKCICKEVK